MKTLVIVNGFPLAGKDEFIDFCQESIDLPTIKHSTIDTVKEAAKLFGWNGEKTPEMRNLLSEMKDLYTKYFDGPLNEIKKELENYEIVFTCMREPAEIDRTVDWCLDNGIRCFTVLVRSHREEINHGSHSDLNVLDFSYGNTINNYGSLDDLKYIAENFSLALTTVPK